METMNMSSPKLPPGFRFHPTDQELIIDYLKKKVSSCPNPIVSIIADVDIYKFNPWELPGKALFGESEWFFFSPRDRKYPNGARPNRAAASGYWKATGTDKPIISSSGTRCLGVKKALAFYQGRPRTGTKTNWMMLEYRLIDDNIQSPRLRGSMRLDDWVLCRVRQKTRAPRRVKEFYNIDNRISPFTTSGHLQGQEIMDMNDPLEDSYYDLLQAYNHLLSPLQLEEADHGQGQIGSETWSPEYPVSDFDSTSNMVSSNEEVLETIEKVLSIGALDELVPQLPPNASTCYKEDNHENNLQIPSPFTSASNPLCFAEFII